MPELPAVPKYCQACTGYLLEGWVAEGKQLQVGHIAIAKPAPAQLGINLTMQPLPPEYPLHAAVDQGGEGTPDTGKNGACCAEAAIGLLCCCDAVIDCFDLGEVTRCIVVSAVVKLYPSGEPHLPFQVKPLSSVLMDDLKVAHKYGGDDGA